MLSTLALAALARPLRLNEDDCDLLFRLAGNEPPGADRIAMVVRASVLRLVLDRMVDLPALVLSAKSDVLAWNPMAAALLGDFSRWPPARRNIVWQAFLGNGPNRVVLAPEDIDTITATWVASLHAARARYPADPGLQRLITELRTGSPRFERLWAERRAGHLRNTRKIIDHPDLGCLILDCDTLLVPDSDQTVVVYSAAPGTSEAGALELLRVTGTEQFTDLRP
ncbi:MmyB family transcriptional regulator [Nocardia cyriacigeorgica]|uniref:MmyB family transcriptional regulator n=1 Tax=Nocardia cyriacigeorgica TaxID=135487 RepID=UPI0018F86BB4|nr:transcriptional regulator [Nocardia cyriacigeorgica]